MFIFWIPRYHIKLYIVMCGSAHDAQHQLYQLHDVSKKTKNQAYLKYIQVILNEKVQPKNKITVRCVELIQGSRLSSE